MCSVNRRPSVRFSVSLAALIAVLFGGGCPVLLPAQESVLPRSASRESVAAENEVKPSFEVLRDVVLRKDPGVDHFRADIDLDVLPSGKQGRILLTVTNPTEERIEFASTSGTCACSQIRTSAFVIPPGGSITVEIPIRTMEYAHQPGGVIHFLFADSGRNRVIEVYARFRLAGLLHFLNQAETVQIPIGASVGEHLIPFLMTEPVKASDIEIEPTGALRDAVFEIVPGAEVSHVKASASAVAVADGALAGELVIRDPVSGRRSSTMVTIEQAQPLVVRPLVTWFRPVPAEGEGVFRASAMLVLHAGLPAATADDEPEQAGPPEKAEFGGATPGFPGMNFEAIQLNDRTCRIICTLKLTPDEIVALREGRFPRKGDIQWTAVRKGERHTTNTKFEILSR